MKQRFEIQVDSDLSAADLKNAIKNALHQGVVSLGWIEWVPSPGENEGRNLSALRDDETPVNLFHGDKVWSNFAWKNRADEDAEPTAVKAIVALYIISNYHLNPSDCTFTIAWD